MDGADGRLLALRHAPVVRAYLATPNTAVYIARRNGDILWAAGAFQDLFGYTASDLVGRNAWTIFPFPEDLKDAAKASALLNEGDAVFWLHLLRADGQRGWFRVDALNREGGVILAFRREVDPTECHFHALRLPHRA